MLFYNGFDRNNKKRWIPIFMGMTDKMGTIHRAPTLGKMRKGIDSHFHGNDIWGNGNDREEKTGFFISV